VVGVVVVVVALLVAVWVVEVKLKVLEVYFVVVYWYQVMYLLWLVLCVFCYKVVLPFVIFFFDLNLEKLIDHMKLCLKLTLNLLV
jgi:hypothetical protein